MKRFRFRLQPLLRMRTHEERRRQQEFARALRKVRAQEEKIAHMEHVLLEEEKMILERKKGLLDIASMIAHENFAFGMGLRMQLSRKALHPLRKNMAVKQQELVDATRSKRVLEELQSRQKEAYDREMDRLETLELNEMAIQRFRPPMQELDA